MLFQEIQLKSTTEVKVKLMRLKLHGLSLYELSNSLFNFGLFLRGPPIFTKPGSTHFLLANPSIFHAQATKKSRCRQQCLFQGITSNLSSYGPCTPSFWIPHPVSEINICLYDLGFLFFNVETISLVWVSPNERQNIDQNLKSTSKNRYT